MTAAGPNSRNTRPSLPTDHGSAKPGASGGGETKSDISFSPRSRLLKDVTGG
jgi:hypothetical protein